MQNSKPQIVEKFKMTYIIALREFTSVQYGHYQCTVWAKISIKKYLPAPIYVW